MSVTRYENKTKVANISPNVDDILNAIYPIGVIVCGAKPTVGTWEKVAGRFLLGSSSSHKAGSKGGEESHKLTTNEMPAHDHTIIPWAVIDRGQEVTAAYAMLNDGRGNVASTAGVKVTSAGGGQAHNNMPPYLSVDMWRRTA